MSLESLEWVGPTCLHKTSKGSGIVNQGDSRHTCPWPRPPLSLQPHIQSIHHRPPSCSRRRSSSSSSAAISDGPRICIPMFSSGGSTLDGVNASAAWSIGRLVGGRSVSSIGVGGIDVGSMKGPWSTASVDDIGAAAPFARRTPSPDGDATGYSGRTSGEEVVGDELLLSGGSTSVRALLDLLGVGEVEYKSRLVSCSGESLSLKEPRKGSGWVEVASDQSRDTRFETLPTTDWDERTDSRATFRRRRSASSQRLRV